VGDRLGRQAAQRKIVMRPLCLCLIALWVKRLDEVWLERLAPHAPIDQYWHNRTGEDNADAHLKRQIMGREVVVAVTKGQLDFGTWERIFYGEFDGRRRKRVLVKIIGE
jgi:secondary thiamine-phosphate synthase enzyme